MTTLRQRIRRSALATPARRRAVHAMSQSVLDVLWRRSWVSRDAVANKPSSVANRARVLWLDSLPDLPLDEISAKARNQVDVMIPVGPNDADVAALAVAGVRLNLRDPLGSVTVVTTGELVERLSSALPGVQVIDEASILTEHEVQYVRAATRPHRSSWYLQQLVKLKWCLERAGDVTYVIDADTVLVRPQRLHTPRGDVLFLAQEYHEPYFDHLARLYGSGFRRPLFGTTVHQMLYRREWLRAMADEIERASAGRTWIEAIVDAIDPEVLSGFSEGECYGQWVLRRRPRSVLVRQFNNTSVSRSAAMSPADPSTPDATVAQLSAVYGTRYDSVSLHYYLDDDPLPQWQDLALQA